MNIDIIMMFLDGVNQFLRRYIMKNDVVVIYVKWITIKGKRIYASTYGKKAFRLEIPREKYRA
jgi:hypothetical protein